ncbi:hypothetical protein BO99DRAFT_439321 [Aspergillus violaceofuscus CBS 115571]|uniref:Uncharacterized protein n=1 Tax=Aspergillus violaceofuscus (strain CBS 115571) TaxID=1450538 RepID=A0A2V5HHR7_ASPV1|nr:hypothetical protein BO99DRAFT_439321 [Aspergillus violaceofuscus CBS 115571]
MIAKDEEISIQARAMRSYMSNSSSDRLISRPRHSCTPTEPHSSQEVKPRHYDCLPRKVSEKDDRDTSGGSLPASSRPPFAIPSAARAWIPSPPILPSSTDIKSTGYDTVAFEPCRTLRQLRGQDIIPHRSSIRSWSPFMSSAHGPGQTVDCTANFSPPIPRCRGNSAFETAALECERGWLLDPFFRAHFSPVMEGILERTEDQHVHFVEPEDFGLVVELAKQVVQRGFTRVSSTGSI